MTYDYESYDVMTFAHDSYHKLWVSCMWLIWAYDLIYRLWLITGMLISDSYESSGGFYAMTHYE